MWVTPQLYNITVKFFRNQGYVIINMLGKNVLNKTEMFVYDLRPTTISFHQLAMSFDNNIQYQT